MAEKKELKKTSAKFYAAGKVKVNKKDGFEIDITSKNNDDYIYSRATLHLECGKERLSFAQLMGGYSSSNPLKIRAFGKDDKGKDDYKKQIEIDWEDRLDEDVIKKVANGNLITVGLEKYTDSKDGKEKILYKKFLSAYDAIPYIQEHLVEDSIVKINGDIKFNEFNNETKINKNITSIYLANVEEEDFYATFRSHILIDKDSLGEEDEEGLIQLSYYVIDWNKNGKQNVMIPHYINIDPKRYKKWETTKKKFQPKNDEVWVWGIEGKFQYKVETVETTVDDLPDDLQEMVDEGMITEEEAKARAVSGTKSNEIMLFTAFQTRKNKDGLDEYDKQDDLYTTDDYVFSSAFEEVKEEKSSKKSNKKDKTPKNPFEGLDDVTKSDGLDDFFDGLMDGLE